MIAGERVIKIELATLASMEAAEEGEPRDDERLKKIAGDPEIIWLKEGDHLVLLRHRESW